MELFKPLIDNQEILLINENVYNQPLPNHINDNLLNFYQNKFWIIELTVGHRNLPPLSLGTVFHYQSGKMVTKDDYPFHQSIQLPIIKGDMPTIVLTKEAGIGSEDHKDFLYFPHWSVKIFDIQMDSNRVLIKGQIGNYD